jgi:hypothetical protein
LYGLDINYFRYTRNNPVNSNDQSGLSPQAIGCVTGAIVGVGVAVVGDWWNNNLDVCRTSIKSILNAIIGCASGALLANPVTLSLYLVDAANAAGYPAIATLLWNSPTFRQLGTQGAGIGLGLLTALTDSVSDALCCKLGL